MMATSQSSKLDSIDEEKEEEEEERSFGCLCKEWRERERKQNIYNRSVRTVQLLFPRKFLLINISATMRCTHTFLVTKEKEGGQEVEPR